MNKELKNVLGATESKAQYDASAKRLLGQKSILAHILVKTVDEFQGMNPREVEKYIEGTPCISTVPVEPGLTNAVRGGNGERLTGFNTESGELQEGLVRFDIVFYVRLPGQTGRGELTQVIIMVISIIWKLLENYVKREYFSGSFSVFFLAITLRKAYSKS